MQYELIFTQIGMKRFDLPVLIWPVQRPTTKSAMNVSSVSPDLCDTMTPQPQDWANLHASMDSVTEPIWKDGRIICNSYNLALENIDDVSITRKLD